MPIVGWKGERVRLVPPDRTLHLENALLWLNDPEITATLKLNLGITRRQEEMFFDRSRRATQPTSSGRSSTRPISTSASSASTRSTGDIAGRPAAWSSASASAWGRGYATDAVRVRTRFAFGELGLHRIEGHTMNPAMKRVYEKCGYRHEGVARRKFWRDGRWHDADLYAFLDEDWLAFQARNSSYRAQTDATRSE